MKRWFPTVLSAASIGFTEFRFCANSSACAAKAHAPTTTTQPAANVLGNTLRVNMVDLLDTAAQNDSEPRNGSFDHHGQIGCGFCHRRVIFSDRPRRRGIVLST